jgi:hypothetical protein
MSKATNEAAGASHQAVGMQAEAALQPWDAKPVDARAKKKTKNATEFLSIFTFHTPLEFNCNFLIHTEGQICPQFNQKKKLFKCFVQRKLNPTNPPHNLCIGYVW